ncbi:MAG: hypothetical protein DCC58_02230 [Chloroflexi bacterium]|nr:MAG: hypothetical protein DCC58_02230 [Chloroflexota bacterium]
MTSESRAYRLDDMLRIAEMRQGAMRQSVRPGPWERGGGRVLTDDGQIIATTLVDPLRQFFGGRNESVMPHSSDKGDSKVDAIKVVRRIEQSSFTTALPGAMCEANMMPATTGSLMRLRA